MIFQICCGEVSWTRIHMKMGLRGALSFMCIESKAQNAHLSHISQCHQKHFIKLLQQERDAQILKCKQCFFSDTHN